MRVRVSDLAQFASCPKRSKIQGLRQIGKVNPTKAMHKGSKMHEKYSRPYKNFERRHFRYLLKHEFEGHCFIRNLGDIEVRGIPDDYRVLCHYGGVKQLFKKTVSIVEVKTTSMKRLWTNEVAVAVLQLQIYIWLMQPYFDILGYEMHPRHYLEIYSQKTGKLIKRIMVEALPYPEKKIRYIIESWKERMASPPKWICKRCPKNVKEKCSTWIYHNSLKLSRA